MKMKKPVWLRASLSARRWSGLVVLPSALVLGGFAACSSSNGNSTGETNDASGALVARWHVRHVGVLRVSSTRERLRRRERVRRASPRGCAVARNRLWAPT